MARACPPHGPRIWVTRGLGLRRGHQPASPQGFAGPTRRGAHVVLMHSAKYQQAEVLPGPEDTAPGLKRRGPSPKAAPRQPRPPQAVAPMGGTLRHCQSAQARHQQAGQRRRRRTHQRLESNSYVTSTLRKHFQVLFVIYAPNTLVGCTNVNSIELIKSKGNSAFP
jgi:hypothetical protein